MNLFIHSATGKWNELKDLVLGDKYKNIFSSVHSSMTTPMHMSLISNSSYLYLSDEITYTFFDVLVIAGRWQIIHNVLLIIYAKTGLHKTL